MNEKLFRLGRKLLHEVMNIELYEDYKNLLKYSSS